MNDFVLQGDTSLATCGRAGLTNLPALAKRSEKLLFCAIEMTENRDAPYVWVSWITRLISGEDQCRWKSWFKSNYRGYSKVPSDFDIALWSAQHNQLLADTAESLAAEGYKVYTEGENSFALRGRNGATLGGKADIVGVKDGDVIVIDCKTGNPKNSDVIQVLIYMLALPATVAHCKGKTPRGRLQYKDSAVEIPKDGLDEEFKQQLAETRNVIANADAPPKSPSYSECRFCDITMQDCPERVDEDPNIASTELF